MQGGRALETVQGKLGEARLAEFNANPNNDPSLYTQVLLGDGVQIASGTPTYDDTGHITNMNELTFKPNESLQWLQDYVGRMVGFDERVLISKSYAKLRQVTLTYNVPTAFFGNSGIRASISLVGRNLLYFAKRKDIDLDSFIGTNTSSQMLQSPTTRRYGFNINLTF